MNKETHSLPRAEAAPWSQELVGTLGGNCGDSTDGLEGEKNSWGLQLLPEFYLQEPYQLLRVLRWKKVLLLVKSNNF